jgi:YHS domain-containing protein
MQKKRILIFLLAIATFKSASTYAQGNAHLRQTTFNLENGVALKGYDPVAYLKQGKAIRGRKEISAMVEGVTYYFSSDDERKIFLSDPRSYEPAYGGWCAYAMGATGEKVDIDPETFKVEKGRLFVFYNRFFNNTLPKWNKDEEHLRTQADQNWMKLFKPKP